MKRDDLLLTVALIGLAVLVLTQGEDIVTAVIPSPSTGMQTSETGKANIVRWEGWRRQPYQDTGGLWTIGVGHLIIRSDGLLHDNAWSQDADGHWHINDLGLAMLGSIALTDGQVGDLFARDLATAEGIVRRYVRVTLTQGQFDALADFAFNIGVDQFRKSTLVRLLNNNDYQGAFNELPKWRYDDGREIAQLVERRKAGQQLFLA